MKKIIVPEEMLRAACRSGTTTADDAEPILEAALRWLSGNPIAPTDEQLKKMENARLHQNQSPPHDPERWLCTEWQRLMFLAEPKVPEEIKDLLESDDEEKCFCTPDHNRMVLEAFRRDQKSKE